MQSVWVETNSHFSFGCYLLLSFRNWAQVFLAFLLCWPVAKKNKQKQNECIDNDSGTLHIYSYFCTICKPSHQQVYNKRLYCGHLSVSVRCNSSFNVLLMTKVVRQGTKSFQSDGKGRLWFYRVFFFSTTRIYLVNNVTW